jgi:Flp pilus assembly pilin Flp
MVERMGRISRAIAQLVGETDAQDLVEYAMLAALIALAAIVAVTSVGTSIYSVFWQTIAATPI